MIFRKYFWGKFVHWNVLISNKWRFCIIYKGFYSWNEISTIKKFLLFCSLKSKRLMCHVQKIISYAKMLQYYKNYSKLQALFQALFQEDYNFKRNFPRLCLFIKRTPWNIHFKNICISELIYIVFFERE